MRIDWCFPPVDGHFGDFGVWRFGTKNLCGLAVELKKAC